jgi:hypothetical protein
MLSSSSRFALWAARRVVKGSSEKTPVFLRLPNGRLFRVAQTSAGEVIAVKEIE